MSGRIQAHSEGEEDLKYNVGVMTVNRVPETLTLRRFSGLFQLMLGRLPGFPERGVVVRHIGWPARRRMRRGQLPHIRNANTNSQAHFECQF